MPGGRSFRRIFNQTSKNYIKLKKINLVLQGFAENENFLSKAAMAKLSTVQVSKDLVSNLDATIYKLHDLRQKPPLSSSLQWANDSFRGCHEY